MTDYREVAKRLAPCTCQGRPPEMAAADRHYSNCPVELREDIVAALAAAKREGRREAFGTMAQWHESEAAMLDNSRGRPIKSWGCGVTDGNISGHRHGASHARALAAKEQP